MNNRNDSKLSQKPASADEPAPIVADRVIDITADICPMTFVRTRLALDRLPKGAVLKVLLRGDEPLRNVPATAAALGHSVLRLEPPVCGISALWLRRG